MLGAGGHASVAASVLRDQGISIAGIYAKTPASSSDIFAGIPFFFDDGDPPPFECTDFDLVNGLGSLPGKNARVDLHKRFKRLGFKFLTVVAPTSVVSEYAKLEEGVHILHRAVINAGAHIGVSTIVNTGAIVEHDCKIGDHNHLAPGCTVSGGVSTGDNVHIGVGASVIQGLSIGSNVLIAAGATAVNNIEPSDSLYPAKPFLLKKSRRTDEI